MNNNSDISDTSGKSGKSGKSGNNTATMNTSKQKLLLPSVMEKLEEIAMENGKDGTRKRKQRDSSEDDLEEESDEELED